MTKTARVLLGLVVLLGFSGTPQVKASPQDEILISYFDECLNELGEHVITCFNGIYEWGQQSGKYKEVERIPCDSGPVEIHWYEWIDGDWVPMVGNPTGC